MELEVLVFPHLHDGADRLLPLVAALVARHVERGLLHRRRPAGAPLDPAVREDVGRRHLLGDAHRRRERVRHERDAEAEAQVLRALRQRPDDHLGCRRVRAPLAEVVLDVPRAVEAEGVGELDLLDRLPVRALLGLALAVRVGLRPRLRHVDLVQQVELHPRLPVCSWRPTLPRTIIEPPMGANAMFEYQPIWAERFAELAASVRTVVGDDALRIDHIGSTSVPGLASKNVVDIQVTVAALDGDS